MKTVFLLILFPSMAAFAEPCDLSLKVSGTVSMGVEVLVSMDICSPDEAMRKVDVNWKGSVVTDKRLPRQKIVDYMKAIDLAEKEMQAQPISKGSCNHPLEVEVIRAGKKEVSVACEKTAAHSIAKKFHDIIRNAYFWKETGP